MSKTNARMETVGSWRTAAMKGLVFGGATLTATDIAVAAGQAEVGDSSAAAHPDPKLVSAALAIIEQLGETACDRVRLTADPASVLVEGGGSILVRDRIGDLVSTRPP